MILLVKEITGTYVDKISHLIGKSSSAINAMDSATCVRMTLSVGADRASTAGIS